MWKGVSEPTVCADYINKQTYGIVWRTGCICTIQSVTSFTAVTVSGGRTLKFNTVNTKAKSSSSSVNIFWRWYYIATFLVLDLIYRAFLSLKNLNPQKFTTFRTMDLPSYLGKTWATDREYLSVPNPTQYVFPPLFTFKTKKEDPSFKTLIVLGFKDFLRFS